MSNEGRWFIGIGAVILVLVVLLLATEGDDTPDRCASPPETPCITSDGLVLVPRFEGGLETITLEEWREGLAEYGEYQRDQFGEPGFGPQSP